MSYLGQALKALRPAHNFRVENGTTIIWLDKRPKPTEKEINDKIAELDAAEPMRLLRQERNRKLVDSDWTQYRDVSLSNDSDWKTYRQALRDLPSTTEPQLDENGQLTNVTWPTKPE